MPRLNVQTPSVGWQIVVLASGLLSGTAFGSTTVLDPTQVAREFSQRSWQKKDGLPDNQVQALLQTRNGYLWIGTRRGLARFDGLKFTVFDHFNTPEMTNDDCRSLAEDTEGNLWIAGNGLLCWRDGKFKQYTRKDGLTDDDVGSVYADRRGNVWIGSNEGLDRLRNGKVVHFGSEQSVVRMRDYRLHEDSSGVLWAGGVFYRFDESKDRFEIWPDTSGLGISVCAIQDDRSGGLWVLGSTQTLVWELRRIRDGRLEKPARQFRTDIPPGFLSTDRHGGLWMASGEGALDWLSNGEFTRYSLPLEFTNEVVTCLTQDREGNLWLGTRSSGLHCWKPKAISAYSTRDGLAHDSTWTVCEARDGSVWIGTEQGVSQFKDGRFRNFAKGDGLTGDKIRSVAEDASRAVWVGTGSGLSVIHDGAVTRQAFPHELERDKTRVVYPAKNGALWLGTVDGLFQFQAGAWTTFQTTNGLANADVRALREGRAGNLWIGTAGGGLQSFREGKFTTFTTTNGLSNNFVFALREDTDGVLWIGTERGLNRFENGRFDTFTTHDGLPDDLVNEILEDDSGNLWMSHDRGIYRVPKIELNDVAAGRSKSVHAVSYDESDGLPTNETNGQKSYPAGCKTRDGRLWFPTPKGVAIIDPKLCDRDTVAPNAVVEQVRSDGEIIFDNGAANRPSLSGTATNVTVRSLTPPHSPAPSAGEGGRLRLPPGSGRVLEFRYTAPVFTAPEKAAFRYRLRGADDRWIEAGTRREAYFTRLRPGAYDFEVIAANHRGVWGEKSANFAFSIQPFYYQTWWFLVGCGLGTAGLIAGLVVWRIRELRKLHRLEQQSAIAGERTRIAKDLHDGLGADLTRLTMLADLASGETGAGGEHARKLSQTSRAAARELKEMIWVANPANDTVDGLVSRISQNAEDFLGDARINCVLDLAPQLPTQPLSLEHRRNLLLVAREALNNVVKHAHATEVRLRARGSDGRFELVIEDNGHGFDPKTARADGLGLNSMRKRVENLGGTFTLASRPGVGTKITIELKL